MTSLFGIVSKGGDTPPADWLAPMQSAILTNSSCVSSTWRSPGLAIGAADLSRQLAEPEVSADRRYHLWAVGELFAGAPGTPTDLQHAVVRREVLSRLVVSGPAALAELDGEYQVALWDAWDRTLMLACDRFGSLPLYWCATDYGLAFGGRVGALLSAPDVTADPDPDAIREAVTFGGFRLGDRTNVRGIRMLRGARALTYRAGDVDVRRYWNWPTQPEPSRRRIDDLVEEAHGLWRASVGRRLHNAQRCGNTLSGGLDSRAILAEGTAQGAVWESVTYGMPRCDDVRIAKAAAETAGATWHFRPLYDDRPEQGWFDRRVAHIAATDGLIQLADLMHFESFDLQTAVMDVHLCGYLGDVVCGPTYGAVLQPEDVLQTMPYSGDPIGWDFSRALEWAKTAIDDVAPGAPRYVLFEHKLAQAIHRIFQASQGRIRVRRPFLDHALFDFYSGLDVETRRRVYYTMLKRKYPSLFARLPHQATNQPVLTPRAQVHAQRVLRYAWRRAQSAAARVGLGRPALSRSYHDEETHWRVPAVSRRMKEMILRPGSISAEVFGRQALTTFVEGWFRGGPGPAQTIGALYVFEHYHHLLAGRRVGKLPVATSAAL